MKSEEIYSQGYAFPLYNIVENVRYWRWRDEEYTLPAGAVRLYDVPGLKFQVALIEDVRKAARGAD